MENEEVQGTEQKDFNLNDYLKDLPKRDTSSFVYGSLGPGRAFQFELPDGLTVEQYNDFAEIALKIYGILLEEKLTTKDKMNVLKVAENYIDYHELICRTLGLKKDDYFA